MEARFALSVRNAVLNVLRSRRRREPLNRAGGTPPPVNKGGRPRGIPNKVTPTVEKVIFSMKAEKRKVAVIARELRLSRQTVYEVLKRA